MLKSLFLIAFLFGHDSMAHIHHHHHPVATCVPRVCGEEFLPVCGKELIGSCWRVRIFNNPCLMESANDCNLANFIPCVPVACEASPVIWTHHGHHSNVELLP